LCVGGRSTISGPIHTVHRGTIMAFRRFDENPLITPSQVSPSGPGLEVMCAFNAGVTEYNGEVLLLIRVAERPVPEPGYVSTIVLNRETDSPRFKTIRYRLDDPNLSIDDPRIFHYDDRFYLTSLSHLRVARSPDGRRFTVEDTPALMPAEWYEEFGIEDAHITKIGDTFWITAVGVSFLGVATALYSTTDFIEFARHGVIFPCDNRDVTIFPEKIDGEYMALHRPMSGFSGPAIWTASSPDLVRWGSHRFLMGPGPGQWDSGRVGASTVPIRTDRGWLGIFHGATDHNDYSLGTLLLDGDDPTRLIARSDQPVLRPEAAYERDGLMSNVVFSCGCIERAGIVLLYYGAGDRCIAGAEATVAELIATL